MKKTRIFSRLAFAFVLLSMVAFSCKEKVDDPPKDNEEEVITTLTLSFIDSAGIAPAFSATFRDPDGDGGLAPDIFDDINLAANTSYNVTLELLNETVTPAEDITIEVQSEGDEHLFCYTVNGAIVAIERTDTDGVLEVGVETKWVTGAVSSGQVQVVLKHQPDVKDGTCAPGDTDIDITFTLVVQ